MRRYHKGGITSVVATGSESYSIKYVYDDLGQLVRENNEKLGKTFIYSYDNAGNITETKAYAYTTSSAAPSGAYTTETYTYSSSNWGDLLTSYNGSTITYDALGNPLTYYNNRTFAWEGRQMLSATTASGNLYFKYNDNGLRVSKIKNGIETVYYYDVTRLVAEKNQNETIIYIYDDYGSVIGMQYRLTTYAYDAWDVYWFERNLQGDIVAVYNTTGTKLISYTYDAWGNITTTYYNNGASTTAVKNPFRYRGYYYDQDLGLYYLQTRYYDSVTGRFISADNTDVLTATPNALTDKNLYAYCDNNPVMRADHNGEFWLKIIGGAAFGMVGQLVSDITSSLMNGEWSLSPLSSYIGAAVGGAVGGLMPGHKALGDLVGSAVTTVVSMVGNNIENAITGKDEYHCFEKIAFTTMNNVMITGLSSLFIRTEVGTKISNDTVSDSLVTGLTGLWDGFWSSRAFSNFSNLAHGWS